MATTEIGQGNFTLQFTLKSFVKYSSIFPPGFPYPFDPSPKTPTAEPKDTALTQPQQQDQETTQPSTDLAQQKLDLLSQIVGLPFPNPPPLGLAVPDPPSSLGLSGGSLISPSLESLRQKAEKHKQQIMEQEEQNSEKKE